MTVPKKYNCYELGNESSRIVQKGWGFERIIINEEYCLKELCFNKNGKTSAHFHAKKKELFRCLEGEFLIEITDTKNAEVYNITLFEGDCLTILPLTPHRIICVEEGILEEVSTHDEPEDSYRVGLGDSQNKP